MQDLAGGAAAAALSLPIGIALGVVTLQALGPQFASHGVAAGVYGVILCSVLRVLLGYRGTTINVPVSITAIFVAAMLLEAAGVHRTVTREVPPAEFVYAAAFLFLALTGAFQALIGLFRLGALVKYLPHSVLAGFMNAVAILLAIAQVPALLGMPAGASPLEVLVAPWQVRPAAALIAGITLAAYVLARTMSRRMPPTITALAAGWGSHHLLEAGGLVASSGPTLGVAPSLLPRLDTAALFPELMDSVAFAQVLPGLAAAAFGLAVIVSLQSLLYMKAFERLTHQRRDAQRELARIGISNTIASMLGAIPCAISYSSSEANHDAGGRTAVSLLAHAAIVLAAVVVLGPLLGTIPHAVVAAILLVLAWRLIDRPTLATVRKLASGKVQNRARLAIDVLVMLAVASIAMLASVPLAVAAGLLIAMLSFLVNMSHSVVRRVSHGDVLRSRRSRSPAQAEILSRVGSSIAVIELEGVIFFGTADDLLEIIDGCLKRGASHVIIDLGRVNDVDTTGAQMLIQIDDHVRSKGRSLLVSQAAPGLPQWDFLVDTGVVKSLGAGAFTPDIDRALEIAENRLIEAEQGERSERAEIPLRQLQPFALLTPGELAVLASRLERRMFGPGEFVFREGDPGDELYVIAMGTASVRRMDGTRSMRLVTFGEGTVFGEMALLDPNPRSASVQADGALVCHVMTREVFDELVEAHQGIALKLMKSLSQELGRRLRFANETINHLQG